MKKIFTILLILSGMLKIATAQTPNWTWAVAAGGGGNYEYANGLAIDDSGYLYIGGRYSGTITFGAYSAVDPSTYNCYPYLSKFDTAGKCKWLEGRGITSGNDYPRAFCIDHGVSPNVYDCGVAGSGQGAYVEKYNGSGVFQWAPPVLGNAGYYGESPGAHGIAADTAGNVYVTGETGGGSYTFGDSTITFAGTSLQEMFLTKMNKSGNYLWAVGASGINNAANGYDVGRGVAVDYTGQYVFVAGSYTGTPSFHSRKSSDDITGPATANGVQYANLFIAKYDTAGNLIWVTYGVNAGIPDVNVPWSTDVGASYSIAVDSCDNVFVSGQYAGTATFGPVTLNAIGTNDGFLATCNSKGQWQWAKDIGSPGATDYGGSVAIDKNDDVYFGTTINGTANFGNGITETVAHQTACIAKYANSTGDVQWVLTAGGSGTSSDGGVAIDKNKFVYFTGSYTGSITIGSNTLTANSSNFGLFIAKLDTVAPRYIVPAVSGNYCPGSTSLLPYSLTGTFNSGNVFTAQLSDSTGSFVNAVNIGDTTTANGGGVYITIPANTKPGSTYLIRVISSSPATSSYVNGCGAYFQKNVYLNNFYVTIGGGSISAKVSNDTTVCPGVALQLHASGGSSYLWSPGALLNDSTSANPYLAPLVSQTYTVTVSSGSCRSATAMVAVTVNPVATINVTPDSVTICSGSTALLEASGGLTYSWLPTTGLSCATCANPGAAPTVSTTYTVNGNGGTCSNSVLVPVTVGNTAKSGVASAVRDTICSGTPGSLLLTGSSGMGIQWQSSPDDVTFSNALNDTLSTYKTAPLTQTTFYRAVVGKGNCMAISNTDTLYVPPSLTASFYSTPGSANQLTFNSDSSLGNIRSYHWDFGDGQTSDLQNPQHTYAKDSTYYVCLTLYDGSNCSYTFCRYSSITDGVQTISAAGNWVIYPNPFGSQLTVSPAHAGFAVGRKMQSIEMYDVLGRVVVNAEVGNSTNTSLQLDVSSLAKGMYYVMIRTANADYVQKVVKQ